MGIRYLFGEQKSLAGFFGFLVLGILVFTLIQLGDSLLEVLGGLIASWVGEDPGEYATLEEIELFRFGDVVFAVTGGVVFALAVGLRIVPGHGARRRGTEIRDEIRRASDAGASADEIESRLIHRFGNAEAMRRRIDRFLSEESEVAIAAQHAILPLLPRNPRAAKRLVSQLRLTLLIASGRGLMDPGSQVTGEHLARWIVLADRWPEFADRMVNHLTRDTGGTAADLVDDLPTGTEIQAFLHNGPPLDTVMQHIVHLAPRVSPAQLR
jgi:hypothetical protein